MSGFAVELAPDVEGEVGSAFLWYFERNPIAADAFRFEVFAGIDAIAENPELYAVDEDGIRRCVLDHFPYSLHYEITGNTVTVLAVAHHSRSPGYWHDR